MKPTPPTQVYIGLNHSSGWLGKLIAWVQAPAEVIIGDGHKIATHARLGFAYEDGTHEFYEAYEGRGFYGPVPEKKVFDWIMKRADKRWTRRYYVTSMSEDEVNLIHKRTKSYVGRYSYSIPQLLLMYLNRRIKLPLVSSPHKVVCSEAVARLLYPHYDLRENDDFERVTPYSIQKRMQAALISGDAAIG